VVQVLQDLFCVLLRVLFYLWSLFYPLHSYIITWSTLFDDNDEYVLQSVYLSLSVNTTWNIDAMKLCAWCSADDATHPIVPLRRDQSIGRVITPLINLSHVFLPGWLTLFYESSQINIDPCFSSSSHMRMWCTYSRSLFLYPIRHATPRRSENDLNSQDSYCMLFNIQFLARDSMLSALYAIANPSVCPSVRLSVCLSVRHTGGSVKNGWTYHRNSFTNW